MGESKPNKLADELKQLGVTWGVVVRSGTVVLLGPGEFDGSPMLEYSENDLNEAVKQGLLQKTTKEYSDTAGKSFTFESYVIPR